MLATASLEMATGVCGDGVVRQCVGDIGDSIVGDRVRDVGVGVVQVCLG